MEASGGKEEPVAVRGGAENWPFGDAKVNHDARCVASTHRRDVTRVRTSICLTLPPRGVAFGAMPTRMLLLVLHYDGTNFSGWQRQPDRRTVQGELETALSRLCAGPVAGARLRSNGCRRPCAGSGGRGARTREVGSACDATRAERAPPGRSLGGRRACDARRLSRAIQRDGTSVQLLRGHGRRGGLSLPTPHGVGRAATARRRRARTRLRRPSSASTASAASPSAGTAPADDDHRCTVRRAEWRTRPGGLVFEIEANRFLHHMVRFLVGTMIDVALGRRPVADIDDAAPRRATTPTCPLPRRRTRSSSTGCAIRATSISPRHEDLPGHRQHRRRRVGRRARHARRRAHLARPPGRRRGRRDAHHLPSCAASSMVRSSRRSTPWTRPKRIATARSSRSSPTRSSSSLPLVEETLGAMRRLQADGVRVSATPGVQHARRRCSPRAPARRVSSSAVDRLDAAGHDGVTTIAELRAAFDASDAECDVIALNAIVAGAVRRMRRRRRRCRRRSRGPCRALLVHPLTDRGIDEFLGDVTRLRRAWPS